MTGNNYVLNMTLFQDWMATADSKGVFTLQTMATRAYNRFQQSIATNPNFYYGPFTGTIARNAGYIFVSRFFSNYSSANPNGLLSKLLHVDLKVYRLTPHSPGYPKEHLRDHWQW